MKKRKPAIIIVLILLALILSACSRKQKEEVTSLTDAWPQTEEISEQPSISFPQDSPKPQNSENAPAETDAVDGYELATLPLPEGMVMATAQLSIRDKVYTAGIGATGAVFGYSCADHTRKTLELPKEYEFVYAMCQDGDNYSLLCGSYPIAYYDFEDNFTLNDPPKGDFEIITFDSNDTYISTLQLAERYTQNGFTFKQIYRINGGYILQCRAAIIVIGDDGNEKGRITLDETRQFDSLQMVGDEAFAISVDVAYNNAELHTLNLETYEMETSLFFQNTKICGMGFDAEGRLLLNDQTTNANALCYVNLQTGNLQEAFLWAAVGLATQSFLEIRPWQAGYVLYEPYQNYISYLRRSDTSKKQELTIASDGNVAIASIVSDFNMSQDRYLVKLVNYGTEDRSMDLLRTEIMAGKAPNLYCFKTPNDFGANAYADLLPYLDADPEYGRDWFIKSLLTSMTEDGRLYWLPYTFAVDTWVAANDDFDHAGISIEELQERLQELGSERPPFESFVTSEWLIGWYSRFALGKFVDQTSAACSFDSPEFSAALQMCKDWGQSGGTETLGQRCVLEFENIQDIIRIGTIGELYHDNYCYVGFPTSSGNGSMFELLSCFAISAQGDKQEAAWEFIRFALGNLQPDGLLGVGIPASQSALDERLQFLIETGQTFLEFTHKIKPSDADAFRALIENTSMVENSEQGILKIITDESVSFFTGSKTASEAAALIQNRVQLYLMENR